MNVHPELKPMEYIFKDIDITMNYAAAQGIVPEIELVIRTIQERFRSLYHKLPYNAILKVMVQYGVKHVVKWLNMFTPKGRVSKTYIQRNILRARPLYYKNITR